MAQETTPVHAYLGLVDNIVNWVSIKKELSRLVIDLLFNRLLLFFGLNQLCEKRASVLQLAQW